MERKKMSLAKFVKKFFEGYFHQKSEIFVTFEKTNKAMAYKKYTNKNVTELLELQIYKVELFENETINLVQPTEWLLKSLSIAKTLNNTTEKAVCETLVSPILIETKVNNATRIDLFSGEQLNVDSNRNLNGEIDFLFTKLMHSLTIQTPIFCVVEAKIGFIDKGIPQAAAQMYAARLKNEQEGKPIPIIYGAVTDGKTWRFLKLEKQILYTDLTILYLDNVPLLLGTLQWVIDFYA